MSPRDTTPMPQDNRRPARQRTGGFSDEVIGPAERNDSVPRLNEGVEAVLRGEIAKLRSEKQEWERIQRVAKESRTVSYPPRIIASPLPPRPAPTPGPVAAPAAGPTLTQAAIGLLVALTLLGTPLGVYLSTSAAATAAEVERQKRQMQKDAEEAIKDTKENDRELAAMKAELQAFKAYFIEVQRLQGVKIRRPEGLPEAPKLDSSAPLHDPNRVTAGPSLTIQTPP